MEKEEDGEGESWGNVLNPTRKPLFITTTRDKGLSRCKVLSSVVGMGKRTWEGLSLRKK